MIKYEILTLMVTELGHPLLEGKPKSGRSRLPANRADTERLRRLLRTRCERPSCGRAKQRDELPPLHSITSSARASSVGGIVKPRAIAVLRLTTSSYLVGACTGRSA